MHARLILNTAIYITHVYVLLLNINMHIMNIQISQIL